MGKKELKRSWRAEPDDHDFQAAENYLCLTFPPSVSAALVQGLRAATTVHWQAKDLLRASRLALLHAEDALVAGHLRKVARGGTLAPVLLVRGDARVGLPLTVADGYHRICASYHIQEDAEIPCRLTDLPRPGP